MANVRATIDSSIVVGRRSIEDLGDAAALAERVAEVTREQVPEDT